MRKSAPLPIDLGNLSQLAPELAATLAAIASDIALVVDANGIIRNVALGANQTGASNAWVGRAWVDTVTESTRRKVEMLLSEASTTGLSRHRQVSHAAESGVEIPMTYAAIRLGIDGPLLVAGRDLRAIAAIQQRFIKSQQEMERDYWARRQEESRYRLLFQVATDAVLVVDAQTLRVLDANPAAGQLFGLSRDRLMGEMPTIGVELKARRSVEEMLRGARSSGKPALSRTRILANGKIMSISATPFRGDREMLLLVRINATELEHNSSEVASKLSGAVEKMLEGVVVTDSGGSVLMANPAFLELCGLASGTTLKGRSIGAWFGDPKNDLVSILAEIRQRGMAARPDASVRTASGDRRIVELSAALLSDGEQDHIGFTLRARTTPEAPVTAAVASLAKSIEALQGRLGQAPLSDLLEAASRLAESHLLHTALEQCQGDHQQAAAFLSMSTKVFTARIQELASPSDARRGDEAASPVLH